METMNPGGLSMLSDLRCLRCRDPRPDDAPEALCPRDLLGLGSELSWGPGDEQEALAQFLPLRPPVSALLPSRSRISATSREIVTVPSGINRAV
jgi:hypothetical protein